jgi:hypothetical protein
VLDKHAQAADIMDKAEAKSLLRQYAKSCINTTKHCRARMKLRDVTMADIMYVINWGDVVSVEESPEHQNHVCTVKGIDTDEDELIFVAAIDQKTESVICITVHDS